MRLKYSSMTSCVTHPPRRFNFGTSKSEKRRKKETEKRKSKKKKGNERTFLIALIAPSNFRQSYQKIKKKERERERERERKEKILSGEIRSLFSAGGIPPRVPRVPRVPRDERHLELIGRRELFFPFRFFLFFFFFFFFFILINQNIRFLPDKSRAADAIV